LLSESHRRSEEVGFKDAVKKEWYIFVRHCNSFHFLRYKLTAAYNSLSYCITCNGAENFIDKFMENLSFLGLKLDQMTNEWKATCIALLVDSVIIYFGRSSQYPYSAPSCLSIKHKVFVRNSLPVTAESKYQYILCLVWWLHSKPIDLKTCILYLKQNVPCLRRNIMSDILQHLLNYVVNYVCHSLAHKSCFNYFLVKNNI